MGNGKIGCEIVSGAEKKKTEGLGTRMPWVFLQCHISIQMLESQKEQQLQKAMWKGLIEVLTVQPRARTLIETEARDPSMSVASAEQNTKSSSCGNDHPKQEAGLRAPVRK